MIGVSYRHEDERDAKGSIGGAGCGLGNRPYHTHRYNTLCMEIFNISSILHTTKSLYIPHIQKM